MRIAHWLCTVVLAICLVNFERPAYAADLRLPPCLHVAACALIQGAVAGACMGVCASTAITAAVGASGCYACVALNAGTSISYIEYCYNNTEACVGPITDWYYSNNTWPPQAACSNNCVQCCLTNSNKWCRGIDRPEITIGAPNIAPVFYPADTRCSDFYYSSCFKTCACPGGSNLSPLQPKKGQNSACNVPRPPQPQPSRPVSPAPPARLPPAGTCRQKCQNCNPFNAYPNGCWVTNHNCRSGSCPQPLEPCAPNQRGQERTMLCQ